MQGLSFTAEQSRLVLAGELDVVYHRMTLWPEETARFIHTTGKYWAALAADGRTLGSVTSPFAVDERVFLAEPWSLLGGQAPRGIAYEADLLPLAPARFWAAPHLMPWNASRRQLVVHSIMPSPAPFDPRPTVGPVEIDWQVFCTGRNIPDASRWFWRIEFALVPSALDPLVFAHQQQAAAQQEKKTPWPKNP